VKGGGGPWPKSDNKLKSKLRCKLKKDIYFHTPTAKQIIEWGIPYGRQHNNNQTNM
jgi:hypothetical protein